MATERTESACLTILQGYEDRLQAVLLTAATRIDSALYNYKIGDKSVNRDTYIKALEAQVTYWRDQVTRAQLQSGGEQWTQLDVEITDHGEDVGSYQGDEDYGSFEMP